MYLIHECVRIVYFRSSAHLTNFFRLDSLKVSNKHKNIAVPLAVITFGSVPLLLRAKSASKKETFSFIKKSLVGNIFSFITETIISGSVKYLSTN